MSLSHTLAAALVFVLPLTTLAGQFGLKSRTPDRPWPGYYKVLQDRLPTCAACFAYWDLRFQFDQDGLDPDFAGEQRWAVTVQVGWQPGTESETMSIRIWHNQGGSGHTEPVALANPGDPVNVYFDYEWDPVTFVVWWTPAGSLESTVEEFTYPLLPGTRFKRAVVQAKMSTALPFVGTVRLYDEGNNFRKRFWLPITNQAGCTRDTTVPANEFRAVCTPPPPRRR